MLRFLNDRNRLYYGHRVRIITRRLIDFIKHMLQTLRGSIWKWWKEVQEKTTTKKVAECHASQGRDKAEHIVTPWVGQTDFLRNETSHLLRAGSLVVASDVRSSGGVELTSDAWRQPLIRPDVRPFFSFFYGGSPFFGGENGFFSPPSEIRANRRQRRHSTQEAHDERVEKRSCEIELRSTFEAWLLQR